MRHKEDKRMKATQQRYKLHHAAQVREQTSFHAGQLGGVNCPPSSTYAADKMTVEAYSKLPSRASGPYCIIRTTSGTLTIDQNGITNKISLERASLAPNSMQP